MPFTVTPVFIAFFVLLNIALMARIGPARHKTGISLGDGGDDTLQRLVRGHGNFIEVVPITLIAMASAELLGTPAYLLWIAGAILVVTRLVHYYSIQADGRETARFVGTLGSVLVMVGSAGAIIWQLYVS